MDFLLALLLSTSSNPTPGKVEPRARATVTILRPHKASPETWDPISNRTQKEVIRKEKDGSSIRLRLTEFE